MNLDFLDWDFTKKEPEMETDNKPESTAETVTAASTPDLAPLYYNKGGIRYQLLTQGVCSHCAHCGLALTDATSIGRGIGPTCSKKGYFDEVEPRDDADAMIALAEYPELVNYLVEHIRPKGNRELVNTLVRIASLNRRDPIHAAISDAIDSLGYVKLASCLRESLSVVSLHESATHPDHYSMWVKKSEFSWSFWGQVKNLPGVFMTRQPKRATMVPKKWRRNLAEALVQHYKGLYIKTDKGAFKIGPEWLGKPKPQPAATQEPEMPDFDD